MSSETVGWAFRYSPLTGAAFQVHLAIADSVNDQHNYELWMRQGVLAIKARVSRKSANEAVARMLEVGLLELLEEHRGGANRYRFLMPEIANVYDPRAVTLGGKGATRGDSRVPPTVTPPRREPVTSGDTEPKGITQERSQGELSARGADAASLDDLCDQLADAINAHRNGTGRPKITAAWRRDMRLLVERGELGVEGAKGHPPDVVARAIGFTFERLADPGRDGFCWADQVQSPGALRRHWPKLAEAKRKLEQGTGPSKGGRTIDRVAERLLAEQGNRPHLELLPGADTGG